MHVISKKQTHDQVVRKEKRVSTELEKQMDKDRRTEKRDRRESVKKSWARLSDE